MATTSAIDGGATPARLEGPGTPGAAKESKTGQDAARAAGHAGSELGHG